MAQVKITTQTIQIPNSNITAFEARPENISDIQAGLVLAQEIFGVNSHIRRVCEDYARLGFWVVTPAYFDHVEKNIELKYDQEGFQKGFGLMQKIGYETYSADTKNTGEWLKAKLAEHKDRKRRLGIVGYCMGGSLTWTMACKTQGIFDAGSSYYGGQVLNSMHDIANIPVILHFGKKDPHIPIKKVREFITEHPELPVYLYEADHGFNCDERGSFHAPSALLAFTRTLSFFARYLKVKL
jgi:carboxymethylenebutenolidase